MPAATEASEPNDTGVAVKRTAPPSGVGTTWVETCEEVPDGPVARTGGAGTERCLVGCEAIDRFRVPERARTGAKEVGTWVRIPLPLDVGAGVADRTNAAF
jgi:hypothetical protein